jgi:hypothetical protein
MTSSLWQRSDGQLLKALREQAGLDPIVLARMGTMTVQQVRGLEEGEGGSFYSPEIKAHMGRTLLAKLGYVAPPATQEAADPEPLPAADPVAPAPAPAHLPEPARLASPPVSLTPGPQARLRGPGWMVWAGGGVMALSALVVILIRPAPVATPAAVPTAQALVPPTLETPQVAVALQAASEAAPVARVQAAAPAPTDPACTGDARSGTVYTPSEPRKAGNFVHLVADKPISLCVVDASSKSTRIALEPGVGRTVPGAAPFVVRGELAHLKIFFQGVRVQTSAGAGDQVVLNEAPLR